MRALVLVILLCCAPAAFAQGEMTEMIAPVEVFKNGYIQVVAESEAGQKRYRALRSAQVVAQARLLEIIKGLQIHGSTSVSEGMLMSDEINLTVRGFLKGAVSCGKQYFPAEGYAKACLRLNLRGSDSMYQAFLPHIRSNNMDVPELPSFDPVISTLDQTLHAQPQGVVYDGLILDVRSLGFRPAMVNRILTMDKQVVFGPSKVVNQLLIKRGCGGYVSDMIQARRLLASWGSSTPLIVRGARVDKGTDVLISASDATVLYANNERSNLVAQARVVFVLK